MVEFYRALRAHPDRGEAFALEQAQLAALKENGSNLRQVIRPSGPLTFCWEGTNL